MSNIIAALNKTINYNVGIPKNSLLDYDSIQWFDAINLVELRP